jgi:hypothetical protein
MKYSWCRVLLLLILGISSTVVVFAGNGKITGVVKDAATGEPVVGANVVIEGTFLGAATDVQGNYFILNVGPGTYNLKASAVGYTAGVVANVHVGADQIVTVDFALQVQAVGMPEVVVEAQRPPVDKSQTSTRTTLSGNDFRNLPVLNVTQLVSTSASTFNGFVRGGKIYETKTLVDGIDVTDQYYAAAADVSGGSTPFMTYNGVNRQAQATRSSLIDLNLNSIEEANVLTGGIGSDYSSASAGVISYSLLEGRGKLTGGADLRVSQTGGLGMIGPNIYNDAAVYMAQKALLSNSATQSDRDKAGRFTWTPGKYSYGQLPEYNGQVNVGGSLSDDFGMYFTGGLYNSHGRLPAEFTQRVDGSLKAHYNLSPDLRLNFTGLLEDRGELFGWKNRTYMDDFRYFLEGVPKWDGMNYTGAIKLTHVLSPSTFYEVQLSTVNDNSRRGYSDDNNDGQIGLYENGPFLTFADTAQVNRYMANASGSQMNKFFSPTPRNESASELGIVSDGVSNWKIARPGIYYENFWNRAISLRGDFTSQITSIHQLRAGVQGTWHTFDMTRRAGYIGGVFPTYQNYVQEIWKIHPKEWALYAQDRIEYVGLIINLGFRLDGLDLAAADNANYFGPFVDTKDANGGPVRLQIRGANVPVKWFFSPRIGVSHPISDRAATYFSFSQEQQSQPFSRLYTDYNDFGNPSLPVIVRLNQDPIRSTSYELGVQWAFYEDYSLDVNSYYKDIQNYSIVGLVVTPKAPWRSYNLMTDYGYADTRGVELTVRKNLGPVTSFLSIGGRISYAYSYVKQSVYVGGNVTSYSTASGDSAKYGGGLPFSDIQYWNSIEQNVTASNTTLTGGYDRPHRITFNLFMHFPYGIALTGVGTFQSGFYYPLTLGDPRSRLLGQSPWDKRVDLRLEKAIAVPGIARFAIYADVINVFNSTSILAYQRNTDVGQQAFEKTGDPTGGPTISRPVTQDGSMIYDVPREVYFGLNITF